MPPVTLFFLSFELYLANSSFPLSRCSISRNLPPESTDPKTIILPHFFLQEGIDTKQVDEIGEDNSRCISSGCLLSSDLSISTIGTVSASASASTSTSASASASASACSATI